MREGQAHGARDDCSFGGKFCLGHIPSMPRRRGKGCLVKLATYHQLKYTASKGLVLTKTCAGTCGRNPRADVDVGLATLHATTSSTA